MLNCNITNILCNAKFKNLKRNAKRLNNFRTRKVREICIIKSKVRVASLRKTVFCFQTTFKRTIPLVWAQVYCQSTVVIFDFICCPEHKSIPDKRQ